MVSSRALAPLSSEGDASRGDGTTDVFTADTGEEEVTDAAAPESHFRELEPAALPSFEALYDTHVDFVYRSVRRLGVAESAAEDVTQDVFIIVHRRLSTFEGRSSLKTWIFGVVTGVVRNHRRRFARRRTNEGADEAEAHIERAEAPESEGPHSRAERHEALQFLYAVLERMDDDKRELFVLAELEQVPTAEIAELTNAKLFTVYSRLRAAKAEFSSISSRLRASRDWRAR